MTKIFGMMIRPNITAVIKAAIMIYNFPLLYFRYFLIRIRLSYLLSIALFRQKYSLFLI